MDSEVEAQRGDNFAFAGELGGEVQRVEAVVLVREIEQGDAGFHSATEEAPASLDVELQKVVARAVRRVALIALH